MPITASLISENAVDPKKIAIFLSKNNQHAYVYDDAKMRMRLSRNCRTSALEHSPMCFLFVCVASPSDFRIGRILILTLNVQVC